jgi:hypothetical protein
VHPVKVMADGSRPILPALRVPFEEAIAEAARRLQLDVFPGGRRRIPFLFRLPPRILGMRFRV